MVTKLSICAEIEDFKENRLLQLDITKKYPGTSWVPLLYDKLKDKFEIVTSDIALKNVQNKIWEPSEIYVIQHQDHFESELLIKYGAKPLILISMESPIYSPHFIKTGKLIGEKYPNRIMLTAFYDCFEFKSGRNLELYFPSYFSNSLSPIKPIQERLFMTVILRNMYSNYYSILYTYNITDLMKLFLRFIYNFKTLIFKKNIFKFKQLHDARLKSIIFFLEKKCLTLYGYGWDNLSNLPKYYSKKLKILFLEYPPKECKEKIPTLRQYKFSLCYENAAYAGGVSEKIIDCIVAGVVPIYLGAFDIENYIPKNVFIDARKFSTNDDLYNHLLKLTDIEILEIINSGRKFLSSTNGYKFSYEGFSDLVTNCILSSINSTKN